MNKSAQANTQGVPLRKIGDACLGLVFSFLDADTRFTLPDTCKWFKHVSSARNAWPLVGLALESTDVREALAETKSVAVSFMPGVYDLMSPDINSWVLRLPAFFERLEHLEISFDDIAG
jgi:hypothetical protein